MNLYKEKCKSNLNFLLERLSKVDQLSLNVYHDCIRFIQLVEPKSTLDIINCWKETGKINKGHVDSFRKIVVGGESKKNRVLRSESVGLIITEICTLLWPYAGYIDLVFFRWVIGNIWNTRARVILWLADAEK
ncbi:hypothetical protein GCM10027180_32090 [Microbulbifer echini]